MLTGFRILPPAFSDLCLLTLHKAKGGFCSSCSIDWVSRALSAALEEQIFMPLQWGHYIPVAEFHSWLFFMSREENNSNLVLVFQAQKNMSFQRKLTDKCTGLGCGCFPGVLSWASGIIETCRSQDVVGRRETEKEKERSREQTLQFVLVCNPPNSDRVADYSSTQR